MSDDDNDVKRATLPYLPKQVQIDRLDPQGRLISPENAENLSKAFEQANSSRLGPEQLKALGIESSYDVIAVKKNDELRIFVIYDATCLGKGAFGSVGIVQDISSGEFCAVKIQDATSSQAARRCANEEEKLGWVKQFEGGATYVKPGVDGNPDKEMRVTVMSLAPGEQVEKLMQAGKLTPKDSFKIATGVAKELNALHRLDIIHRDIKPENILYEKANGTVKLVDYGLAEKLQNGVFRGVCAGSPGYMPTDKRRVLFQEHVVKSHEASDQHEYTPAGDIYSLGITTANMLKLVQIVVPDKDSQDVNHPAVIDLKPGMSPFRAQTVTFLQTMTAEKDQATMPDVITRFEAIDKMMSCDKPEKVAVFDAQAFSVADQKIKQEMILALKGCDYAIMLVGANEVDNRMLQEVKREVENAGVNVRSEYFHGEDLDKVVEKAVEVVVQRSDAKMVEFTGVTVGDTGVNSNKAEIAVAETVKEPQANTDEHTRHMRIGG